MKKKKILNIVGSLVIAASFTAYVNAQEYEDTIEPGLNISKKTPGSALARAARAGKSIVIYSAEPGEPGIAVPKSDTYVVKEGDTMWSICDRHFTDPYVWPRLWSINPSITNPHWIYPGDVINLTQQKAKKVNVRSKKTDEVYESQDIYFDPNTIFMRNRGFVDSKMIEEAGKIDGAYKEIQFLAQYDEAYVKFPESSNVKVGERLRVFRIIKSVDYIDKPGKIGKLVEILGEVRIVTIDPKTRIARVYVEETTNWFERGALIGHVKDRFTRTPQVENEHNVKGHLIAFMDPTILSAEHQLVFVDRGKEEGVKIGNRFFVVQARDKWRESRNEKDDIKGYPKEVVAELRVLETRPNTSTCLVTNSTREMKIGEPVEMRKGY